MDHRRNAVYCSPRCRKRAWSRRRVRSYRFAAHRWPAGQRRQGVSHKVHYILASIPEDAERFKTIDAPPLDERARVRRWTTGLAKKRVGQRPDRPETPAQKVAAIHRLADDDEVAARVATDVLRRPEVAAKVVADDTAPAHGQQGSDHAAQDRGRP
ncbi:DUF6192 family protein [Streptomyces sp. NPDC002888]|uniref:DUF6192 family protein n=1 Tax=Streptomyces sp. NPDC002888 TaxID=3364668 RepID=UPI00367E8215